MPSPFFDLAGLAETAAHDEIAFAQTADQLGQDRRIVAQVGVNHPEIGPVRQCETLHHRRSQPQLAGSMHHLQGVLCLQFFSHLPGAVGRVIIDDDQFQIDIRFGRNDLENLLGQ